MVHVDSHKSSLTATEQGTFTAKWVTSVPGKLFDQEGFSSSDCYG